MGRPKHQKKDIEAFMRVMESNGWIITKGKRYFRAKCPCGEHIKSIVLTPSGSRYLINLIKYVERVCQQP